ncbi:MAG: hypothetical protein HKP61_10220, partial [Dactylosporangium sp.]|nr:hypothetical protein [Dactylosporangium sp.]NNJ61306.1 hypothetical protein [Dactylosporangium sp.]
MSALEGPSTTGAPRRSPASGVRPTWEIVLGFALMTPAVVFFLGSYVEPTIWTVRTSLEPLDASRGWTGVPEGSSNYDVAFIGGFGGTLRFALSLLGLPLVAVALVAPAIACCAHRAG